MATLYISEFARVILDARGEAVLAPDWDSLTAEQNVAIGAISAQSQPLNSATRYVLLNMDEACSLAYGLNPVANPAFHRCGPNETRFYGATSGNRIAVVQNV